MQWLIGIARLARFQVEAELQAGRHPAFCPSCEDLDSLSAKTVDIAAKQGDPFACKIYEETGKKLGRGLSILIDILNPEMIIIGSIFERSRSEIWPHASLVKQAAILDLPVRLIILADKADKVFPGLEYIPVEKYPHPREKLVPAANARAF